MIEAFALLSLPLVWRWFTSQHMRRMAEQVAHGSEEVRKLNGELENLSETYRQLGSDRRYWLSKQTALTGDIESMRLELQELRQVPEKLAA